MEYVKRKHPRLKEYDYSSAGAYFITICTKDRETALSDIVGRDDPGTPYYIINLTYIGEITDNYIKLIPEKYSNVSLDNYVIMPDHIHLLLTLKSEDILQNKSGVPRSSRPTGSVSQTGVVVK